MQYVNYRTMFRLDNCIDLYFVYLDFCIWKMRNHIIRYSMFIINYYLIWVHSFNAYRVIQNIFREVILELKKYIYIGLQTPSFPSAGHVVCLHENSMSQEVHKISSEYLVDELLMETLTGILDNQELILRTLKMVHVKNVQSRIAQEIWTLQNISEKKKKTFLLLKQNKMILFPVGQNITGFSTKKRIVWNSLKQAKLTFKKNVKIHDNS